VILGDAFDGFQIKPNIVGVEVLELFDTLEFLDVVRGDLSDLQETDGSFVIDDGSAFDIGLCLVGQLHDILGLGIGHVLENVQVDDGTKIVDITDKDDFLAARDQFVKESAVGEGVKQVTVTGWIPRLDRGVVLSRNGKERVFDDSGESGLIECEDVDVVSLVLLDYALGVVFGVERVHQDKGDVAVVGAIEIFDLSDGQVEKGVSFSDFDDGLWTDAAHACPETTVEFEDSEFVEK
jgi:hypothetical protein